MEQSPVLSYEELGNVEDVRGYSVLRLSLSSRQATALPVMASELWGIVRFPRLASVRGLFLDGAVLKAEYEPSHNGTVLVSIHLKEGAS